MATAKKQPVGQHCCRKLHKHCDDCGVCAISVSVGRMAEKARSVILVSMGIEVDYHEMLIGPIPDALVESNASPAEIIAWVEFFRSQGNTPAPIPDSCITIEQRTAWIRQSWDEETFRKRAGMPLFPDPVDIPVEPAMYSHSPY